MEELVRLVLKGQNNGGFIGAIYAVQAPPLIYVALIDIANCDP